MPVILAAHLEVFARLCYSSVCLISSINCGDALLMIDIVRRLQRNRTNRIHIPARELF
jgi:hypothetical protein